MGTLLLFWDGVGLAPATLTNPVATGLAGVGKALGRELANSAVTPPGPHLFGRGSAERGWRALDACLGVPGLPQSGTGQTALFGGFNAPAAVGRHVPAYPTAALRQMLARRNLFSEARRRNWRVRFLNAYRSDPRQARFRPVTTVAAAAAELPVLGLAELEAGTALTHDVTGAWVKAQWPEVPLLTPAVAALRVGALIDRYDLLVHEYFLTDRAGHLQDAAMARSLLAVLDAWVCALLEQLWGTGHRLIIVSDHGNLEDLSTRAHTRNPVPLLAFGPGSHALLRRTGDLSDVLEAVLGR